MALVLFPFRLRNHEENGLSRTSMPAQGGVTHMERRLALGLGLVLLIGGVPVRAGSYQDPGGQGQPDAAPGAAAPAQDGGLPPAIAVPDPPAARPPAEAPGAGKPSSH